MANKMITCVRIGYGTIAYWHQKKMTELGVKTIGVIEKNELKKEKVLLDGHALLHSMAQAISLKPCFYDICVPTQDHLKTIMSIVEKDPSANILVEKPICNISQLSQLKDVLKGFKGKLVVNENYLSSNVTKEFKMLLAKYNFKPTIVHSEMTKNRTKDYLNGRFIDKELFAFGYEGTHLLTNILYLGQEYYPKSIGNYYFKDLRVKDGGKELILTKQSMGEKRYQAKNDSHVVMHTSLDGNINQFYGGYHQSDHICVENTKTRYRIISAEEENTGRKIVGFYEPVDSHERNIGFVNIIENGKVVEKSKPIKDDTILNHFKRTLDYFQDKSCNNPCSASMAIETMDILNSWYNPSNKIN